MIESDHPAELAVIRGADSESGAYSRRAPLSTVGEAAVSGSDRDNFHNRESERAILATFLLGDSRDLFAAVRSLQSSEFGGAHRPIFEQMCALFDAGQPIGKNEVLAGLIASGRLERAGGAGYISGLGDGMPRLLDEPSVNFHIRCIQEQTERRQTAILAQHLDVLANDKDEAHPLQAAHEAVERAMKLQEQGRKSRFELIHASNLDRLPQCDFLPGTHIVKGGLQMWYGLSESGKSIRAMTDAYYLAAHGPVVYVSAEGTGGLSKRRDAILAHYGLEPGEICFVAEPVNLLDSTEISQFVSACKAKYPDGVLLVVFDTKSQCMAGGEENSSASDSLQVAHSNRIRRELGCAEVLLHHSDKLDTTARGSGATYNACDAVLYIQAGCKLLQEPSEPLKSNGDSTLVDSTAELQAYCKPTASEPELYCGGSLLLGEPQLAVQCDACESDGDFWDEGRLRREGDYDLNGDFYEGGGDEQ